MPGPVTTGSILSRSFGLLGAGLVPFLTISFLVYSPLLLWNLVRAAGGGTVSVLASQALAPLATAALIYGVFRSLRGEGSTIGECLGVAMARWLPVLGLTLLITLVTVLGFVALIIPGIIVQCGLFVAVPALIVEELPVRRAYSRSWDLTDGYKLSIFGVFLVLGVIDWGVGELIGFLASGPGEPTLLSSLLGLVATVVVATVEAIAAAVTYHDLRVHKEGLDEEELAAVFE